MTNCLPTKDLLRIKQVQVNMVWPVCNEDAESILHTLVLCPFAKKCWHSAALPMMSGDFQTYGDWLQTVFNHGSKDIILSSVMICWMLWKNRNDLVWNQKCLDASEVVFSALSNLNQWQFVQDK